MSEETEISIDVSENPENSFDSSDRSFEVITESTEQKSPVIQKTESFISNHCEDEDLKLIPSVLKEAKNASSEDEEKENFNKSVQEELKLDDRTDHSEGERTEVTDQNTQIIDQTQNLGNEISEQNDYMTTCGSNVDDIIPNPDRELKKIAMQNICQLGSKDIHNSSVELGDGPVADKNQVEAGHFKEEEAKRSSEKHKPKASQRKNEANGELDNHEDVTLIQQKEKLPEAQIDNLCSDSKPENEVSSEMCTSLKQDATSKSIPDLSLLSTENKRLIQRKMSERTELQIRCQTLEEQNESLVNQLEERERFLEDILADIDEFKEKSRFGMSELRIENVKLKEVTKSQWNKFSIERDYLLKEIEFLKQRIEYLNEDLKFYTDRCDIDNDQKDSPRQEKDDETKQASLSDLKNENENLKLEVESSINLITDLEKNIENKNFEIQKIQKQLEQLKKSSLNIKSSETQTAKFDKNFIDQEIQTLSQPKDVDEDICLDLSKNYELQSVPEVFITSIQCSIQTDQTDSKKLSAFGAQTETEFVDKVIYDLLLADYTKANEDNENLQNMVVDKICEIDQNSCLLDALNSQLFEMTSQNELIKSESLKTIDEKDEQIKKVVNDFNEQSENMQNVADRLKKLSEDNHSKDEELRIKIAEIGSIENELQQKYDEISHLEQEKLSASNALSNANIEIEKLKFTLEEKTSQFSELENKHRENLVSKEKEHSQKTEQLGAILTTIKTENAKLKNRISALETESELLLESKQKLDNDLKIIHLSAEKQRAELEKLLETEEDLSKSVQKYQESIEKLQCELREKTESHEAKLIEEKTRFNSILQFKLEEKENQMLEVVQMLLKSEERLKEIEVSKRGSTLTSEEKTVQTSDFRHLVATTGIQTEMVCGEVKVTQTSTASHCEESNKRPPFREIDVQTEMNQPIDDEIEKLRTSYGNLEVELNMVKAQFSQEKEDLTQVLFESQQECARFQTTLVQMKTHYEQTARKVNETNEANDKVKPASSGHAVNPESKDKLQEQVINLKQRNSELSDENNKLKRKLDTKVEVLDEINEKISSIASSLSLRRPRVQRKHQRNQANFPTHTPTSTPVIDSRNLSPVNMRGHLGVIGCDTSWPTLGTNRTLTEDTGFSSEYSSTPQLNMAHDQLSVQNLRSYLHTIKAYLEDVGCNSSASIGERSPERISSPNRSSSINSSDAFSRSETPSGNVATALARKEHEIQNLKKQLDERDEYISQRRFQRQPSTDRASMQKILDENSFLKTKLDELNSVGLESEAKAQQLAKHLEEKYQSDMTALGELQTKVVSVANLKQKEIVELEQSLQKVLHENNFLKDELRRMHQKLLTKRTQSTSLLHQGDQPDLDNNPVAFITQLRNLYNKSP